jgi:hypothetical protein
MNVFIAALLVIAKNWKCPKFLSAGEWKYNMFESPSNYTV